MLKLTWFCGWNANVYDDNHDFASISNRDRVGQNQAKRMLVSVKVELLVKKNPSIHVMYKASCSLIIKHGSCAKM